MESSRVPDGHVIPQGAPHSRQSLRTLKLKGRGYQLGLHLPPNPPGTPACTCHTTSAPYIPQTVRLLSLSCFPMSCRSVNALNGSHPPLPHRGRDGSLSFEALPKQQELLQHLGNWMRAVISVVTVNSGPVRPGPERSLLGIKDMGSPGSQTSQRKFCPLGRSSRSGQPRGRPQHSLQSGKPQAPIHEAHLNPSFNLKSFLPIFNMKNKVGVGEGWGVRTRRSLCMRPSDQRGTAPVTSFHCHWCGTTGSKGPEWSFTPMGLLPPDSRSGQGPQLRTWETCLLVLRVQRQGSSLRS